MFMKLLNTLISISLLTVSAEDTLYEKCYSDDDCSFEQYDQEQKCAKHYVNNVK